LVYIFLGNFDEVLFITPDAAILPYMMIIIEITASYKPECLICIVWCYPCMFPLFYQKSYLITEH